MECTCKTACELSESEIMTAQQLGLEPQWVHNFLDVHMRNIQTIITNKLNERNHLDSEFHHDPRG